MSAVEVVQTELLSEGVEVIIDFALDAVRDIVNEADEGIVAVRGGGVEDILTETRGVELSILSVCAIAKIALW